MRCCKNEKKLDGVHDGVHDVFAIVVVMVATCQSVATGA
jgi:hypothetical protein